MKTLNVFTTLLTILVIFCSLLLIATPQPVIQASSSSGCTICNEGPNARHWTYNYVSYRCLSCGDEWIEYYNKERNDASRCWTYVSSSVQNTYCRLCYCYICNKHPNKTHYTIEYKSYDCKMCDRSWTSRLPDVDNNSTACDVVPLGDPIQTYCSEHTCGECYKGHNETTHFRFTLMLFSCTSGRTAKCFVDWHETIDMEEIANECEDVYSPGQGYKVCPECSKWGF